MGVGEGKSRGGPVLFFFSRQFRYHDMVKILPSSNSLIPNFRTPASTKSKHILPYV